MPGSACSSSCCCAAGAARPSTSPSPSREPRRSIASPSCARACFRSPAPTAPTDERRSSASSPAAAPASSGAQPASSRGATWRKKQPLLQPSALNKQVNSEQLPEESLRWSRNGHATGSPLHACTHTSCGAQVCSTEGRASQHNFKLTSREYGYAYPFAHQWHQRCW